MVRHDPAIQGSFAFFFTHDHQGGCAVADMMDALPAVPTPSFLNAGFHF
jgi:hypothetical protein